MRHRKPVAVCFLASFSACATWCGTLVAGERQPEDEIFYHIMPIAWRDSNNDPQRFGDFGGLTASLDYLEHLGITAVWLNPIFPSPAYHGYQHGAADQINPWFGNEAGFLSFVQAAHARGIRVYVDLVVYGISHNSTWFQSAFGNPASPFDTWLAFTNGSNTQYLGSVYPTWNGATVGFIHWNLNEAGPVGLVTQWSQKWLDPNGDGDPSDGIDGYRLDHVWYEYPSGPNGWGYNIQSFWVPWKQALRQTNPNVFTFAEQADWGSHGVELLAAHDAAFTKPWESAARAALNSENAGALYSQTASTVAALPPGKTFIATIGNHDIDRVTSMLGGSLNKAKAAAAVLLTQPYPPCIYYGDEIGMLGVKRPEYVGDAADIPMREPFKWNAVAGPPMSNYFVLNSAAYNNRYSGNNDGRSVQEQNGVPASLLETHRTLIAARKANIALRRGGYTPVNNSSSNVWTFVRTHEQQQVLVAINLFGATRNPTLNLSGFGLPGGSSTPTNLITGATLAPITTGNSAAYPLSLPAFGFLLLEVQLDPPPPVATRVDGRSIPEDFGASALRAVQNNATGLGDNLAELNALYVRADDDGLLIGMPGNLATNGTGVAILLDTTPGGQNVLDLSNTFPPPAGPNLLTGLRLDSGFAPDHLLFMNAFGGNIFVDQYELLAGGGVNKTYRGQGTVNDGDGLLSGGTNPNGMEFALDNTNTAGVTAVDADGALTATTGFEAFLPYDDIDLSAGHPLRMAAFLMQTNGSVSNQWLPGLGGGFSNLGVAPDMTVIVGDQYVTVSFPLPGDLNCDGIVSPGDIAPFVLALTNPAEYAAQFPSCDALLADINGDGLVSPGDIAGFVALLAG